MYVFSRLCAQSIVLDTACVQGYCVLASKSAEIYKPKLVECNLRRLRELGDVELVSDWLSFFMRRCHILAHPKGELFVRVYMSFELTVWRQQFSTFLHSFVSTKFVFMAY